MNDTVIVTTDLGTFKAFRLHRTEMNTPQLEVINEVELLDAHGRLGDKVTDQAGRYKIPTRSAAMSYGERQKIGLEMRRRLIKQVAGHVREVVESPAVATCYFAASAEVNGQILEEAGPEVRRKIAKNLDCNLTNMDKDALLRHFVETEVPGAR